MTPYRQITVCLVCDKELTEDKKPHEMCYFRVHFAYFFLRKRGYRKGQW